MFAAAAATTVHGRDGIPHESTFRAELFSFFHRKMKGSGGAGGELIKLRETTQRRTYEYKCVKILW